ncbi:MAG: GNAT family N-acetyltransferase [Bacteroidales bacterium]|nr:GNAT family N-acetyltransferase [Bacteroidales bacterium]
MEHYETERLILKPADIEDAAFILELLNTPKWLENIGDRNVKSLQDAEEYIRIKMRPQIERLGYGNFTIIRKEDGAKLGICGLYDREGMEGIDIGFALLPQFEGKGYAFESANRLKELAFGKFGLKEIFAITTIANKASQDLLFRLGMQILKTITFPDDPEELYLFYLSSESEKTLSGKDC